MHSLILHHYPQSPFSEKVRAVLGYKRLTWDSVVIPRILPKPDLLPLTGGYRKTPVLQIGADIYCDSQCIVRELERRYPQPTLYPSGSLGFADALAFWADRQLFWAAVGVAFAARAKAGSIAAEFYADRSKFTGRTFTPESLIAAEPAQRGQLRAMLFWLEQMLAAGQAYLLGAHPSLGDFAIYNPVWFLRQHLGADTAPLVAFPALAAWANRMAAIGHGTSNELSGAQALKVALDAQPATLPAVDPDDPLVGRVGSLVEVTPDDTGRDPVQGRLVAASAQELVLARQQAEVGEVMVHFPRAGFVVTAL